MSVARGLGFLCVLAAWSALAGLGPGGAMAQAGEVEHAAEVSHAAEVERADPVPGEEVPGGGESHGSQAGDGHGGVHIPHDVTAANLSPQTWEVVDFRTDVALFTAVVFLLLLAGLWGAAWKPIMLGLEKRERRIGEFRKRKTLPFNGYGEQVAHLYAGMDLRRFF